LCKNVEYVALFDGLCSYGFSLLYNTPTRIAGNSKTGIYYLLSTLEGSQYSFEVFHSNFSDHSHQLLIVSRSTLGFSNELQKGKKFKRFFNTKNLEKFVNKINKNIQFTMEKLSVNDLVLNFYNEFTHLFETYSPKKSVKIQNTETKPKKNQTSYLILVYF
jgi:hypothetical protein